MADLRRPSRLALAFIAVLLPAVMGWVCHGLVEATTPAAAIGVAIDLPAAPAAASLSRADGADDA